MSAKKKKKKKKGTGSTAIDELGDWLRELNSVPVPDEKWARNNARLAARYSKKILESIEHLESIVAVIDPIRMPDFVFSFNDTRLVGEVVSLKLRHRDKHRFSDVHPFYGSGVYAIYYEGDFEVYEAISKTDCPIYVGSAGPANPQADDPREQGDKLYKRIKEHFTRSLPKSTNLVIDNFSCRFLVVQSGIEKAAEDHLIRVFHPVWNKESKICSGFGKHGDVKRLELSPWDILHGGREWTKHQSSLKGKTVESVTEDVRRHFRQLYENKPEKWEKIFATSWLQSISS